MPTIRPFEPADTEACRRLWRELTMRHRELYDDPTIGGDDPGRGFDAHLAVASGIWLAEVDGEVVGLAGLLRDGDKMELEPVVVTEGRRGRGIGRALAEAVIAAAREQGVRQVSVRPVGRNADAIRFFHALGFDAVSRVELARDLAPRNRRPGERIADRDFRA